MIKMNLVMGRRISFKEKSLDRELVVSASINKRGLFDDGWIYFRVSPEQKYGTIIMLDVPSSCQRRGNASLLVDFAENYCREKGSKEMRIVSINDGFWEHKGYYCYEDGFFRKLL